MRHLPDDFRAPLGLPARKEDHVQSSTASTTRGARAKAESTDVAFRKAFGSGADAAPESVAAEKQAAAVAHAKRVFGAGECGRAALIGGAGGFGTYKVSLRKRS